MKNHVLLFLTILTLTILLSSCNTTKFLAEGESLLNKNEIIILQNGKSYHSKKVPFRVLNFLVKTTDNKPVFNWVYEKIDKSTNSEVWGAIRKSTNDQELEFIEGIRNSNKIYKIRERQTLQYELGQHIIIQPNKSKSKLWLYQRIQHKKKKKLGKSIRKNIAEAPVLLDSLEIEKAVNSMSNYLFGKGYLDAEINYFVETEEKKSNVRYYIHNLKPYFVKSFIINAEDTTILQIINNSSDKSFIKNGDQLSIDHYDLERSRISNMLRNEGFVDFTPNYISKFNAKKKTDSLDIYIDIYNLSDTSNFRKYISNEIRVFIDIPSTTTNRSALNQNKELGISYYYKEDVIPIKASVLNENIVLIPNLHYKQNLVTTTKARLNNLGLYKFIYINVNKVKDSIDQINYDIYLSSLKKMSFGANLDLSIASNNNSSTSRIDIGPLFGTSLSANFKNRNLFRSAAIWDSYLELGTEVSLQPKDSNSNGLRSLNIKFQNRITLPGLTDWNGSYRLFQKIFLNNSQLKKKRENAINLAKSKISATYDYKSIDAFYTSNLFSVSLGFEYPNTNKFWHTTIDQIGIHYLNPTTEIAFDSLIASNPVYQRSFTEQLFTSFVLNEIDFSFTKPANKFGESYKMRLQLELSGLEILGAQSIFNTIFNKKEEFVFLDGIQYSKFIKSTISGSYLRSFDKDQFFGSKLKFGLLIPIENNSPYVKSFYAGGANSLRAWAQRDLGPGGYRYESNSDFPIPFQVGDVLFELISEYRFPIFAYFKGAIFLDIGNIWTINDDDTRENAKLTRDFYKQIAIGTGLGLRLDVDFFVIRFDIGQKVRLPYINEKNNNYWAVNKFNELKFREFNYNLALGYPF